MKAVTIVEFKRDLSALLGAVARGEKIIVQRGRKRENVAILAPYRPEDDQPRQVGILSMRGKPLFKNWDMSEEDFLTSR